jgi:Reverse transcriptase (RNA-dependent DNA polymerase)
MPEGRKLVVNCWDLKQKGDGIFRARLVAFGYFQVAVVDFSDHFSPVPGDISIRIIFLVIQKLELVAWFINVETAFLNEDLSEEI